MNSVALKVRRTRPPCCGPTPTAELLQQLPKLISAQARVSHDAAHAIGVDRIMSRNRDDAWASLARNSKSSLFERLDGALVRDARDPPHLYRYVHFAHLSPRG